jgi:hypothetical protein
MNPFRRCYEDICLSNINTHYILDTHYILAEIGSSFGTAVSKASGMWSARLKLDA